MKLANIKKVYIVNLWGKSFAGFSKGKLNDSYCKLAEEFFKAKGCEIKKTNVAEPYVVEEEIEKYKWADCIFYQSPTNWMGMGWEAKKWADEVWTAGMFGELCNSDGRHRGTPEDGYGTGGVLDGRVYMLSLTFNAPKGAFNRPEEYLFKGKGVDDLWFPFHCNNRFFGLEQVPDSTFGSFDVLKNPIIEEDHKRFKAHIASIFPDEAFPKN